MLSRSAGFSTIECLLALVIFAVGILGSAGTLGLAIRSVQAGAAAASTARLALSLRDSLAARVRAAGDDCGVLAGGRSEAPHGVSASWRVTASGGGSRIELTVSRPGLQGLAADTLIAFVPCR
jgi:hypothetical protein